MKKILLLVFSLLVATSCSSNNNKNQKLLMNDSKSLLEFIQQDNYRFLSKENYFKYYIEKGNLYALDSNYSDGSIIYEEIKGFSSNNITSGLIVKDNDNNIYLSINNSDYCAIKKLYSDDINIYKISDKDKCHSTIFDDEQLSVEIVALYKSNYSLYIPDLSVANDTIALYVSNNVIDAGEIEYIWYRNEKVIEGATGSMYEVDKESEDAYYMVKVITPDGLTASSEYVHVVIQK